MASNKNRNVHFVKRKDHFNEYEFNKIRKIGETDPNKALELYEEYLKLYPSDNSAYTYYISLLISTEHYDKANKLIVKTINELLNNPLYEKNKTKYDFLKYNIIFCKLKLLMFQKKFEEAYALLKKYETFLENLGEEVTLYLQQKLGLLDSTRPFDEKYIFRQIRRYDENDFRDHIKKHEQNYNSNQKEVSISFFSYDVPLDKVIEEIKKKIPNNKAFKEGFFEDSYIFKYVGCGRYNDSIADYFKVVTFRDSSDMITMLPIDGTYNEDQITADLTSLFTKKGNEKVLSGLDRFNRRYKR